MNTKMSLQSRIFLKRIKPFFTILGWMFAVSAIVWAIVNDYSFLGGVSFVIGVQLLFGAVYLVGIGSFIRYKEKKSKA